MSIPSQIDNVEIGLGRLLSQFYDKEKVRSFLSSYLKQIDQTQEDTLYLLNNRSVFNAEGEFLDHIGKLVGVRRGSDDDDTYRDRILDRIKVNNSEGTPKDLLDILKSLTEANTVELFEHYPANTHLFTDGNYRLQSAAKTIRGAAPATVSDVTIISDDPEGTFLPSELLLTPDSSGILATSNDDTIANEDGDNIAVFTYNYGTDDTLAILPELGTDVLHVNDGTTVEPLQVNDGVTVEDLLLFGLQPEDDTPVWAEIYNSNYLVEV